MTAVWPRELEGWVARVLDRALTLLHSNLNLARELDASAQRRSRQRRNTPLGTSLDLTFGRAPTRGSSRASSVQAGSRRETPSAGRRVVMGTLAGSCGASKSFPPGAAVVRRTAPISRNPPFSSSAGPQGGPSGPAALTTLDAEPRRWAMNGGNAGRARVRLETKHGSYQREPIHGSAACACSRGRGRALVHGRRPRVYALRRERG